MPNNYHNKSGSNQLLLLNQDSTDIAEVEIVKSRNDIALQIIIQ